MFKTVVIVTTTMLLAVKLPPRYSGCIRAFGCTVPPMPLRRARNLYIKKKLTPLPEALMIAIEQ